MFNLSSFIISEANHQLTLGYHGIASPFYVCKLLVLCTRRIKLTMRAKERNYYMHDLL